MLFEQRRLLLSCYLSASISHPEQANNRPRLPALQDRRFASSILCITNYFNSDDFSPDASIPRPPLVFVAKSPSCCTTGKKFSVHSLLTTGRRFMAFSTVTFSTVTRICHAKWPSACLRLIKVLIMTNFRRAKQHDDLWKICDAKAAILPVSLLLFLPYKSMQQSRM